MLLPLLKSDVVPLLDHSCITSCTLLSSSEPQGCTFHGFYIISAPKSSNRPSVLLRKLAVRRLSATAERTQPYAAQTASFYEVLGLRAGATCQEIKSAYRKKARVLHPDGRGDPTSAAVEFIRLQAAYATLSDPAKRAAYDRSISRLRPAAVSSLSGCSELTRRRRTWETDQCW